MSRFAVLAEMHTKAQREYSYDKYTDDEIGIEVEDECLSFEQFKQRNPPSVVPPVASRNYALNYPIEGAVGVVDYNCPVTPDPTKKFILSIIVGAERVMDDGKCYEPLTSKNIVVTREGEALFKHLKMVQLSDAAKRAVYDSIGTVITELFKDFPMPEDIQHLISLLKSGKKRALYKIHTSILPHSDRGWQYLKAHEYVMHRADAVSQALIFLALPYLDNWRTKVYLNGVLIEAYEYAKGAYKEDPPVDDFGNPTWSENERKLQSAKKFMDCLRNGTSHRLQRTNRLTSDQYETILLVLFHMLLPKLLEAMFDHLGADGLKKAGLLR